MNYGSIQVGDARDFLRVGGPEGPGARHRRQGSPKSSSYVRHKQQQTSFCTIQTIHPPARFDQDLQVTQTVAMNQQRRETKKEQKEGS